MANRAHITPKVFKWARESAKISIEIAAGKASVSTERLKDWEEGSSLPTIRQAKLLAKAYKRPFAIFFLPEIPNDFQPLQDFRRKDSKELSTASIFIIREIQQKQTWIREINELNEVKHPYVGRFSIGDSAEKVAQDILKTLKVNPGRYESNNPILEWIKQAELNGIFISRTSFIHSKLKLNAEELQGFAIADPFAPFIFINSDDWKAPQLFTLVHELGHIWIAKTGISNNIASEMFDKDKFHPVELFCNEIAAEALMPRKIMVSLDSSFLNNSTEVFKAAKKFGVSSFAFLVRALKLGLISNELYRILKNDADTDFQIFLKKEEELRKKQKAKPGGPNYFLLQLNRNSRLFTQTVLDAFKGGGIDPTHASSLLNVKINKFSKLESQLYK